jgi:hypothetical protein
MTKLGWLTQAFIVLLLLVGVQLSFLVFISHDGASAGHASEKAVDFPSNISIQGRNVLKQGSNLGQNAVLTSLRGRQEARTAEAREATSVEPTMPQGNAQTDKQIAKDKDRDKGKGTETGTKAKTGTKAQETRQDETRQENTPPSTTTEETRLEWVTETRAVRPMEAPPKTPTPPVGEQTKDMARSETFSEESSRPNFCLSENDADIDITLITQCSLDRVWMLRHICQRWRGSFSVAVYVNDFSKTPSTFSIGDLGLQDTGCAGLGIQLLFMQSANELYPVNKLRNMALESVKSSHILMIDVDFWPSDGLRDLILSTAQTNAKHDSGSSLLVDPMYGLVVPAFQRNGIIDGVKCPKWHGEIDCSGYPENAFDMPSTFSELDDCLVRENCLVFQENNNLDGHGTTNSKLWRELGLEFAFTLPLLISNLLSSSMSCTRKTRLVISADDTLL